MDNGGSPFLVMFTEFTVILLAGKDIFLPIFYIFISCVDWIVFECYMKEFLFKVYPLGYGELKLFISIDLDAGEMPNNFFPLLFALVYGGERT